MKKLFILIIVFISSKQLSSQVTQTQLYGTWSLVGLCSENKDSVLIQFVNDSNVRSVFPFKATERLGPNKKGDSFDPKMFLAMMANMMVQFDSVSLFKEGIFSDSTCKKINNIKAYKYSLKENNTLLNTDKNPRSPVRINSGILCISTGSGLTMYFRKVSQKPLY